MEITRLVTDGTSNACSKLYAACARIAKEAGYERIQTYVLDTESGVSLRAAGWHLDRCTEGGDWNCAKRSGRRTDQPMCRKQRWVEELNPPARMSVPTLVVATAPKTRWCSRCEEWLPTRRFYRKSPHWCRSCRSAYYKLRRQSDPAFRNADVERLRRRRKEQAAISHKRGATISGGAIADAAQQGQ